jgi:hypothetical protein
MAYEFFYPGTPYSLEASYGDLFVGYRLPTGVIGGATSVQTANQIQEVSNLLNQGIKTIEVQPLQPEIFETIPKQHFKEIARLQKLAGAETSIHAPIIEPSGFGKSGWSETDRESAERQLKEVIDKSHELSPNGNIPVTIHASAIQGAEFSKPSEKMKEEYRGQFKKRYDRNPTAEEMKVLDEKRVVAINQDTKQMIPVEREVKYYPETGREIRTPTAEIGVVNNTEWVNNITNLAFYKKHADEVMKGAGEILGESAEKLKKIKNPEDFQKLPESEQAAVMQMQRADLFLGNVEAAFRTFYDKAYRFADKQGQDELDKIAHKWREGWKEIQEKNDILTPLRKSALIDQTLGQLRNAAEGRDPKIKPPQVYKPVEEFVGEHSAKTFANVALHGYEKYGNSAPIVSIENLFPGMAFSRSDQLKKLINNARDKFVEGAVKKGHSKGEAKAMAKKIIGATWDVGHLNILRKEGYKTEDIIEETRKIAPFVKHTHLTDNFGHSDSHLPPGMGNVPTKEILEELEKAGVSGKKIIEAGNFVQHFKVAPTQAVLEALGSPLYTMMAAPYWNQTSGTYGSYFSGYGPIFPEQSFSMYGAGFSGMPMELGGQMQGKQSRFSGTPTQ